MANIFDYLQWRGDLSFTQDPPNPVDALIFSTLAYIKHQGAVKEDPQTPMLLSSAAEEFFQLPDYDRLCRMKNDWKLLKAAAETNRFGNIRIVKYKDVLIEEEETQFSAVTFLLDDGSSFVAFRGTDNALVGWKEDFNMSFRQTVPAQILAESYLREVCLSYPARLRIGGHSKGGNLAVYAAARCGPLLQKWILDVYNNDGPGFTEYMMGDPGYKAMVPRIHTYIPQSSIVGLLMEHEEPYTIIHSNQVSILQHDTFTWEIKGKEFVYVENITSDSRFLNRTLKNWLETMSIEERSKFVEVMFGLLATGDIDDAFDVLHPKNLHSYLHTIIKDETLRKGVLRELSGVIEAGRKARYQLAIERQNQRENQLVLDTAAEDH